MKQPTDESTNSAEFPNCDRTDCFANFDSRCDCLTDTNFNGGPCPFYKDRKEIKREEEVFV